MKFQNIPIHICDKAPKDKPYIIAYEPGITFRPGICPFCGEIMKYDTEEFSDGKGRTRHGMPTFYQMLEEMAETHDKKSHDYASNDNPAGNYHFAGKLAQLFAHSHEDAGFVGRLGEKMYRLANLESSQKIALNETIEDTERDICVIVVMWMADRRERRNKKLEAIRKVKEQMNHGTWEGFPPNREIREGDIPKK